MYDTYLPKDSSVLEGKYCSQFSFREEEESNVKIV